MPHGRTALDARTSGHFGARFVRKYTVSGVRLAGAPASRHRYRRKYRVNRNCRRFGRAWSGREQLCSKLARRRLRHARAQKRHKKRFGRPCRTCLSSRIRRREQLEEAIARQHAHTKQLMEDGKRVAAQVDRLEQLAAQVQTLQSVLPQQEMETQKAERDYHEADRHGGSHAGRGTDAAGCPAYARSCRNGRAAARKTSCL